MQDKLVVHPQVWGKNVVHPLFKLQSCRHRWSNARWAVLLERNRASLREIQESEGFCNTSAWARRDSSRRAKKHYWWKMRGRGEGTRAQQAAVPAELRGRASNKYPHLGNWIPACSVLSSKKYCLCRENRALWGHCPAVVKWCGVRMTRRDILTFTLGTLRSVTLVSQHPKASFFFFFFFSFPFPDRNMKHPAERFHTESNACSVKTVRWHPAWNWDVDDDVLPSCPGCFTSCRRVCFFFLVVVRMLNQHLH